MEKLCAICQTPSEPIICAQCYEKWDSVVWVRELIKLEQEHRRIEETETAVIDAYIETDGRLRSADARFVASQPHEPYSLLDDEDLFNPVQQLRSWIKMGGLTAAEQHAYEIMQAGLSLNEAMNLIQEVEQKTVTVSAYRHRIANIVRKIRRATETGQICL